MNTDEARQLRRNFRLYYASEFFANSYFTLPIYVLFGREYLGISYFKTGLLYVAVLSTWTVFDFVSGIIADRWGRKRTFVLGMLLQIVGVLPFVLVKEYWVLITSQILAGLGYALYSSTLDAQIYDESKKVGAIKQFQHANANKQICIFAGRIGASIIGGLTYKIHPTFPYALTALALSLSLFSGMSMRFTTEAIRKSTLLNNKQHLAQVFKLIGQSRALIKFLVVGFICLTTGDLLFSYYQPYYIKLHISSDVLGYLFAGISVLSMAGSYMMRKLPDRLSAHTIQGAKLMAIAITATFLYSLKLPLVLIAPAIVALTSGFVLPNLRLYVNKHATSDIRASVLSFATAVFHAGTATGFFITFYLADRLQPRQILSIIIAGAIIGLAINIFIRPKEVYIDSLEPSE